MPRFDEYVSDPAKPVPYRPRPVDEADGSGWRTWLVNDQRFVDGRPDVLTYVSEPLTKPMKLSGEPIVHLMASTSGTDSDWVVKLIDVYPDSNVKPGDTGGVFPGVIGTESNMSGYELPIGIDIFRGRYRTSFERPEAIKPNVPLEYKFALPLVERTILPGHRLMVQVQSTGSRCTTAIRRRSCRTSSTRSRAITRRRRRRCGMSRGRRATSVCRWCRRASR